MWNEDIRNRCVTVVLGGKDLIVDTEAVKEHLTDDEGVSGRREAWKEGVWNGHGLDVLWFPELDHGQVFDKKNTKARLVDIARSYCVRE